MPAAGYPSARITFLLTPAPSPRAGSFPWLVAVGRLVVFHLLPAFGFDSRMGGSEKQRNEVFYTMDNIGAEMIGRYVIVRTYSAGVHAGVLSARNGREVTLAGSRRIWRWAQANPADGALSGVANWGVGASSKIAGPVESILLLEAIEIIPATDTARASIEAATWEP